MKNSVVLSGKTFYLLCALFIGLIGFNPAPAQSDNPLSAAARSGIAEGNFVPALAELAKIIESEPKNIDAYMLKAMIRRAQGAKYSDLIETEYSQVISINQDYWQAWAKAGEVCLEDKGWSCNKYYIKVKELNPSSSIGYLGYAKGIIYGMPSSNYKELVKTRAIPDLIKAFQLDKNNREVYRQLGLSYDKIDAPDEAVAAYTTGIGSAPKNSELYALRGETKGRQKDYAGAIADFTKAVEINPKAYTVFYSRADIYEKSGDFTNAIADYERIIQIGAKNALAYLNRGKIYLSQKKYALAIDDLGQAVEKGDVVESECGRAYRGVAFLENGELAAAEKDFLQIWETGGYDGRPCYGLAAYHVGNARFKKGKYLWARTAYQNALKGYDKPEVREALQRAEENYEKYESSAAVSERSSSDAQEEGDYNAPKIRTASAARYREAAAAYEKAVDDFNRAARSFTGAVEKYNAAGDAQFLYKGTLERAHRELRVGRSVLENLLNAHGDYLTQNRVDQIGYKLRTIPLSPYSAGYDDYDY